MSDEDIKKLNGLPAHEIIERDNKIYSDVVENRRDILALQKCVFGNGRPSLEQSITAEFDKKLIHNRQNREQADILLSARLDKEEQERKDHIKREVEWIWINMDERTNTINKNGERMEKLSDEVNKLGNKIAYYAGGIAALAILLKYLKI